MSNLGTLRSQVADLVNRSEASASATVVARAIVHAVRKWESHRFDFNSAVDATASASSGSQVLTFSNANAVKFIRAARLYKSSTNQPELRKTRFSSLERDVTGEPCMFAWHKGQMYVSPRPNSNYEVRIDGVEEVLWEGQTTAPIDEDTSASATCSWVTEGHAFDLLLYTAAHWLTVVHFKGEDFGGFAGEANRARAQLKRDVAALQGAGRVKASYL